jgi:4-hydroxy-2-oxovalerate/4-hydroxy-2-oxohexanoate aldolase
MNLSDRVVTLHDMCLRDGMHAKAHQLTLDQMVSIATGLDEAGVPLLEVTHGDGLGGASVNYGFPRHSDTEYLTAVVPKMKRARVSVLLIPGIGTVDELRAAADCGAGTARVATHCTEADISEQHIGLARKLGLDTVGFLMMSHMAPPETIAAQAALMESYGANCVYVTDSAGSMLPDDVTARIGCVRSTVASATEIGFHGHHNLGMGIANSLAAIEAGANRIDGSAAGLGAGAGNTPLEAFIGVCDKLGWKTGVDFLGIVDASEDVIRPAMPEECQLNRMTLMMGYAGVYSSFLKHAGNAAERYGVSGAKILLRAGERKLIGGQEDQLIDIALELKREQESA